MSTKQTLDEIFAKAGVARTILPEHKPKTTRFVIGKLKAMKFAQLLVSHNFSPSKAYAEFKNIPNARTGSAYKWASAWSQNETVQRFVRQILEDAITEAKEFTRNDLAEMLALNRLLIYGDITRLLYERREFSEDGKTFRTRVLLRPLSELTHAERMLVRKIRFKDGEVIGIEGYDRLDAQRTQLALLTAIHASGTSDSDFNHELQRRISQARDRRLELEQAAIAQGKLVRLPSAKGST